MLMGCRDLMFIVIHRSRSSGIVRSGFRPPSELQWSLQRRSINMHASQAHRATHQFMDQPYYSVYVTCSQFESIRLLAICLYCDWLPRPHQGANLDIVVKTKCVWTEVQFMTYSELLLGCQNYILEITLMPRRFVYFCADIEANPR